MAYSSIHIFILGLFFPVGVCNTMPFLGKMLHYVIQDRGGDLAESGDIVFDIRDIHIYFTLSNVLLVFLPTDLSYD